MNMKTKILAAALSVAIAAPVMASGGGGGGGGGFGGGGFGGGNDFERTQRNALTPEQRSFSNGQKEFQRSVSCKKCAYPRGITATKQANEVVSKVKSGEIKVRSSRKRDLLYYMSQRYRVST